MPHSTSEGSGQRARSTSRPAIVKFSNDAHTATEAFPDHVDLSTHQFSEHSSNLSKPIGLNGNLPLAERWTPRKEPESTWMNGSSSTPSRSHGRQKSLSDAIRTIRTRRGSVSANAHEIAEALKAPVSPKLIVNDQTPPPKRLLTPFIDPLHYLVPIVSFDQYVLKVNTERFREACDFNTGTICLRRIILSAFLVAGHYISFTKERDSRPSIWYKKTDSRSHHDHAPSRCFPNWRSSSELESDFDHTSLPCPYN